jgi:hypothetical protein
MCQTCQSGDLFFSALYAPKLLFYGLTFPQAVLYSLV